MSWSPQLSDLTSCDFFLWSYIKALVYTPNSSIDTKEILQNRIQHAFEALKADTEMIQRATNFEIYNAELCLNNEENILKIFCKLKFFNFEKIYRILTVT